jgi:hypothetical protein
VYTDNEFRYSERGIDVKMMVSVDYEDGKANIWFRLDLIF